MFKKQFNKYIPKCEQEIVDKKAIIDFIKHNDDCLERTNLIAHVTASAFVLNKTMDKILFVHHNIFNSWGWVGGHNDSNPNLLDVAMKEAKEETGIIEVVPFDQDMISLDVIFVENHIKNGIFIGDHLHLNATYLLMASEDETLIIKEDENSGVKWFNINDVMYYVTEERIKDIYNKIFDRIKIVKNKLV